MWQPLIPCISPQAPDLAPGALAICSTHHQ
ncbi:hypothetical protein A2U01_0071445, partial [Trifolium medium]|nr:hypothetical protein [Trifolium medium]